jgi:hypothetical protein
MKKLKTIWLVTLLIISIIIEITIYAFIGKELDLIQLILYTIMIFNTLSMIIICQAIQDKLEGE